MLDTVPPKTMEPPTKLDAIEQLAKHREKDPAPPEKPRRRKSRPALPRVIGISGLAGSGKSTAARLLRDGANYEIVPFAGPLKKMLRALGLHQRDVSGGGKCQPNALLCGKTPREAMQTLGTEWGRMLIGTDVWLNAWQQAIKGVDFVVADDVRFENEAGIVRAQGGVVIRIERSKSGTPVGSGHASEQLAFQPDIVIRNDGTPQDLADALMGAIAEASTKRRRKP